MLTAPPDRAVSICPDMAVLGWDPELVVWLEDRHRDDAPAHFMEALADLFLVGKFVVYSCEEDALIFGYAARELVLGDIVRYLRNGTIRQFKWVAVTAVTDAELRVITEVPVEFARGK